MRKLRILILVLVVGAITGYGGFLVGRRELQLQFKNYRPAVVMNKVPILTGKKVEVDFSLFWTVWDKLASQYVDKSALDPQKMVDGAISGMVASLGDPYTVFLPPKENKDAKQDLNGSFEGVGIQLGFKDLPAGRQALAVMSPVEGTPAFKAGVKAGDLILRIKDAKLNVDKTTEGMTIPEAVNVIRGPKGTPVTLTFLRGSKPEPFDVTLVRDTIIVKSATVEFIDEPGLPVGRQVAHLKLNRFGDRTQEEWTDAVSKIYDQGSKIKGIVLDLRNNPGGYLDEAVYLAGEFLPAGRLVVSQQYGDGTKVDLKVNRTGQLVKPKLVVVVNEGSASAAEILAGALQDNHRAKIVGVKTFGKGSVQQPDDFPNGAGIHITIAKWLLPSGRWIDKLGITPDIEIKVDDTATSSSQLETDNQLQKAIELLK